MTKQTVARVEERGSGVPNPNEVIPRMAGRIAMTDPGSAAALRRGPLLGAGAAVFWRLLADHDIEDKNAEAWACVVQAIAVLTPIAGTVKGTETSAHDPTRPMGAALHGVGLSDLRLARLLAARGEMRRELLIRTCRRIARHAEQRRFDLKTLARFAVYGNAATDQMIARDYYRAEERRARAEAAARPKDSHTEEQ